MRIDRRTLLKGMGAAALIGCDAPGQPTPQLALTPALLRARVKTVVVLMMENRSFDHMFGSLSLLEGRDDVDGLTAGMTNPLADGTLVSPSLADVQCVLDPAHGFQSSHRQWNEGRNDGFALLHEELYGPDEAPRALAYLDRSMAPASYALADRYALCQRWFASMLGPTFPNRFYSLLGTSNGVVTNVPLNASLPSLFTRLDEARLPWRQYYGNLPFSALLKGHSLEQDEYQRLEVFFDDAAAGTLPAYVHIDPTYGTNDDHPPCHPLAGQILIASIYAALAQSPQWAETLFVVTYDENGGFFDHVPPPEVADPIPELRRLGFRVPAVVMGPYVKPQVSSTVFDHTSVLASVLRMHELEPLAERDASAADWWSLLDVDALDSGRPDDPVALAPIEADPAIIHAEECQGLTGLLSTKSRASGRGSTGQPELEAFFDARFGQGRGGEQQKDGRLDAEASWARILARARALGVLR